jgi:hypothetical protein
MTEKITENMRVHTKWYEDAKNQTVETLPEFIRHLTEDYEHDYGTICHAVAAAALASASSVNNSKQGGITGFQAGAVMWEFIGHWTHYDEETEVGLRLQKFGDLLYPQYSDKFVTIEKETWTKLQERAKMLVKEHADGKNVHPSVYAHWESIVAGKVPFGLRVRME